MEAVEAGALALRHLFVLCCYGGAPFIDYHTSTEGNDISETATARMIDPTDWMASDLSGSLLNATLHPKFKSRHPELVALVPSDDSGVQLDACDLYNLTFSSVSDENLFYRFRGVFACRCASGRHGRSCEYSNEETTKKMTTKLSTTTTTTTTTIKATTTNQSNCTAPTTVVTLRKLTVLRVTRQPPFTAVTISATTDTAISRNTSIAISATVSAVLATTASTAITNASVIALSYGRDGSELPARWTFSTFLVVMLAIMFAMIGCFRLMRGCFCDCFGGFKNPFGGIERYDAFIDPVALHRCIDAVDAFEQAEKNKNMAGSRRPLILSVSDDCPPYNPTVISGGGGGAPHDSSHFGTSRHRQQPHPQPEPQSRSAQQQQSTHSPPPSYHSSSGSLNVR